MAAVGNGFVDCANLLLNEGANILAVDMYHRSALHRAVSDVASACSATGTKIHRFISAKFCRRISRFVHISPEN